MDMGDVATLVAETTAGKKQDAIPGSISIFSRSKAGLYLIQSG